MKEERSMSGSEAVFDFIDSDISRRKARRGLQAILWRPPVRSKPRFDHHSLDELLLLKQSPGKRLLDIALAAMAVTLLSPALLAVALAVKCTSEGPIIFRQQRAGLGGKPFTIYKFRSMRLNAEAERERLQCFNERGGPAFKMTNDPRVTAIGRFIRKWSLDELPQLFNVLKGDMSLVGPRPLPVIEDRQCSGWRTGRRRVKPGITCIWQVSSRHESDFDHWARLDIRYARSKSPLLDLTLLLKTIPAVLLKRGAC